MNESQHPTLLHMVGVALYGDRWTKSLARAVDVNDRQVRRWMTEGLPVPAHVWAELLYRCRARKVEIGDILPQLREAAKT
jgi:hypothetical protein